MLIYIYIYKCVESVNANDNTCLENTDKNSFQVFI